MSSKMRVLFMGTPEFAVHILDKINQTGYNIVGVVTVPDKPAGRGQKLQESAVAKYAKKHNLNLLQPEKLKAKSFLQNLKNLEIDIAVVVAFRMLPEVVWQIPKKGTFNLHASLLPQYRGAAPINWAIINGESETGVTTFMIDEKIDTGNILLKEKVQILPDENAGELHDKLMEVGGKLVIDTLKGLEDNTLTPQPQQETNELKSAPKIFKDDGKIDWNKSLEEIHNFIRGLSPYPAAWTILHNDNEQKFIKIYQASIQYQQHIHPVRRIIQQNQRMGIAHPDGFIWLEEVQPEGKRRMKILDFLNGMNLSSEAEVGTMN